MGVAETRDFGDLFSRSGVCRWRELHFVGKHESGGNFSHLSRFEFRIVGERYGRIARIYEPWGRDESEGGRNREVDDETDGRNERSDVGFKHKRIGERRKTSEISTRYATEMEKIKATQEDKERLDETSGVAKIRKAAHRVVNGPLKVCARE